MKNFRIIWVLMLSLIVSNVSADQTAAARLHCWSIRLFRGAANDYAGFDWTMDLTTLPSGINNELALDFFDSGYTHSSYVELYSQLYEEADSGAIVLDAPYGGDANGNGFDDFFEVSQPVVGLVSSGVLQSSSFFFNSGIQATWYRDAGSDSGSCILTLPDPSNPFADMSFVHSFEIIEYNGVLSYMPGVSNVKCVLLVTNAPAEDALDGSLVFEKSQIDPQNELYLVDLSLTNSVSQELGLFSESTFLHDMDYPTNYYGYVELVDGDLNTADEDYFSWLLSIDDTNDADQDGIPDFSDDVAVVPPAQPALGIALGPNNVLITLTGEVGRMHEIKSIGNLSDTNWVTVHSVMLTNSPQTELLPKPTETTFWRAVALP